MMNKKPLALLFFTLLSSSVSAHNLKLGESLPQVKVQDKGEIVLNKKDDIYYQSWSTQKLAGKVHIIQAIAGRSSAKEMNASVVSAITKAKFPADKYQTITIINQDDSIWGTGSLVKSSAEDSKKEFPWSSLVLDAKGKVQQSWQLEKDNSAIIVIDKAGKILFAQEGKLSPQQVTKVIELTKANL